MTQPIAPLSGEELGKSETVKSLTGDGRLQNKQARFGFRICGSCMSQGGPPQQRGDRQFGDGPPRLVSQRITWATCHHRRSALFGSSSVCRCAVGWWFEHVCYAIHSMVLKLWRICVMAVVVISETRLLMMRLRTKKKVLIITTTKTFQAKEWCTRTPIAYVFILCNRRKAFFSVFTNSHSTFSFLKSSENRSPGMPIKRNASMVKSNDTSQPNHHSRKSHRDGSSERRGKRETKKRHGKDGREHEKVDRRPNHDATIE